MRGDGAVIQDQIVEAVRSRGYLEGWTNEQLAARQAMKLFEEVAELSECSGGLPVDPKQCGNMMRVIDDMGRWDEKVRAAFDGGDCGTIFITDAAKRELFDIIVVCSVLAHALGVDDMMQGALDKARADIERGVR